MKFGMWVEVDEWCMTVCSMTRFKVKVTGPSIRPPDKPRPCRDKFTYGVLDIDSKICFYYLMILASESRHKWSNLSFLVWLIGAVVCLRAAPHPVAC